MRFDVKKLRRRLGITLVLALAMPACALSGPATTSTSALQQELERLAPAAHAIVGVAAIHIESRRGVFLNADMTFPTASTKKLETAVTLLTLVDQRRLNLQTRVPIEESELYLNGSLPLGHYILAGSSLTVHNLFSLMLTVSDNNAADLLLRMVGGSDAVSARMKELGIVGMTPINPTNVVIARLRGRPDVTEAHPLSPIEYAQLLKAPLGLAAYQARADAFANGSSDTSTPRAMATLLLDIWNRRALSPASTDMLLSTMYRCEIGEDRLKALLPPGTPIAHKTGSDPGSTNDVGIIDLPGGAGHVIAVVFTKAGKVPDAALRAAFIAQAGRAIYDYFLFTSPTEAGRAAEH
jgi:beta-lactamase class A